MNFKQNSVTPPSALASCSLVCLAANLMPSLTAQTGPQDATFGKITCSGLDVENDNSLFWLCYRSDGDNNAALLGMGGIKGEGNLLTQTLNVLAAWCLTRFAHVVAGYFSVGEVGGFIVQPYLIYLSDAII